LIVNDSTTSLRLFLEAFTALDLAQPLLSFDDSTSREVLLAAIAERPHDVVGIRFQGEIARWMHRDDLKVQPPVHRTFEPSMVVESSAPLHVVIQLLNEHEPVFVKSLGRVGGVICRRHTQSAAMRMWLFGLVTVMDLRVTEIIRNRLSDAQWQRHLSAGRLQKAKDLQDERTRRHDTRDLLDCLQLSDKGRIIACEEELRRLTRFHSRRGVEQFVSGLESLRNHLAHSQDFMADWETILDLARNVRKVVMGTDGQQLRK
jgi:hypothetical protein